MLPFTHTWQPLNQCCSTFNYIKGVLYISCFSLFEDPHVMLRVSFQGWQTFTKHKELYTCNYWIHMIHCCFKVCKSTRCEILYGCRLVFVHNCVYTRTNLLHIEVGAPWRYWMVPACTNACISNMILLGAQSSTVTAIIMQYYNTG